MHVKLSLSISRERVLAHQRIYSRGQEPKCVSPQHYLSSVFIIPFPLPLKSLPPSSYSTWAFHFPPHTLSLTSPSLFSFLPLKDLNLLSLYPILPSSLYTLTLLLVHPPPFSPTSLIGALNLHLFLLRPLPSFLHTPFVTRIIADPSWMANPEAATRLASPSES